MQKWSKRYLELAKCVSSWSKDPSTQVGAICVGAKGQILSQGYNGFPRGIKDLPERLNMREEKYRYVVHAEQNCIYNACLNGVGLEGSSIYLYGLPICNECAKGIIQVGVTQVIAQFDPKAAKNKWKESFDTSRTMFKECRIHHVCYDLSGKLINI